MEEGDYSEKGSHAFYAGADYGLSPDYSSEYALKLGAEGQSYSAGAFGFPSNPQTSNQLQAVSQKISVGTKVIEVSGVALGQQAMENIDNIPKQQFQEINRLKKLTGVDLTFHGPLVEPTGIKRGWTDADRKQAEVQMFSAVDRAHDLDPKGNIVVTFHSSNGLPDPQTKIFNPETKKEETTEFWVVNEREGDFANLAPKYDYFKDEKQTPETLLKKQNKDAWFNRLQGVSYHVVQGSDLMERALNPLRYKGEGEGINKEGMFKIYKEYIETGSEEKLKGLDPKAQGFAKDILKEITHADLYLRDAYQQMQNLFNQAYDTAEKDGRKEDIQKLRKFREEITPHLKDIEDPTKINEFTEELTRGLNVLRSINPPETLKPLRKFAIDKASETFSNVALKSYEKFKDNSPIISIENPPVGMGLTRAEDLRELVNISRNKFIQKAVEKGLSKSEAEEQAEKLIGVTWDVGHINLLRKYGYGDKELGKQAEKIAPYVKHIHLSDNFGTEHTELPMGMGNVPLKKHLEELKKAHGDKLAKIKQVVETGAWFKNFNNLTPFRETLRAFGSPVYAMKMAPYWNQAANATGGYFAGYGPMLPEQHFNLYGANYTTLPPELGGQMGGRSRASGNPI